jgi:hypothetical protein
MTARVIPITADDAFTAVANPRRRRAICILTRTTGDMAVSNLAEHIAAIEQQSRPDRLSSDHRRSVYIGLIQNHLDRLDTLGIVDYDDRDKRVRTTDVTPPLAMYIRQLTSICTPREGSRPERAQLHRHVHGTPVEGDDA